MKPNRKSLAGRVLAVAVLAACFLSAPARSSAGAAQPEGPAFFGKDGPSPNRPRSCEAILAACMNNGGDSDACWNAYWRCIS
jgi:hypothetical protein